MHTRTVPTLALGLMLAAGCKSSNSTGAGGSTSSSSTSTSTSTMSGTTTATGATGTTTSTSTGGGTPPSCTGIRYCDDFESYTVGPVMNAAALGPWKASVAGGTMTVDSVKPYSGTKSLHITVAAGAAAHGTLNQTVPTGLVPGNNMFGRAMLFYSNTGGNDLPLAVHSWLFNSAGTSTAAMGNVTMNLGGGGAKLQLNYHPPAPAVEQSVQGGTMTAGVWHCVQWEYDGSGTPSVNDAKVWVDGTLAVEAMPAKGWQFATPWNTFDFGFTHYQTLANGVDVYLDDFALNETMVACPPSPGG